MTKRALLTGLIAICTSAVVAASATAKGTNASVQGATVDGLPYRYVAIAPSSPAEVRRGVKPDSGTFVGEIEKRGGLLKRWWHLAGRYSIPTGAPDDRIGGLSADGGTLVLSRFAWIFPPRTTGLAILDVDLLPPYRRQDQRHRQAIRRVHLDGSFSFDAISPDGSTIYLIEYLKPYYDGPYRVRALDARSGKLLPRPIIDPSEPEERMEGTPFSRVTSQDGRWAYTLYSDHQRGHSDRAHEAFIHALDTVKGKAVCVDLPQLEGRPTSFLLDLDGDGDARTLSVADGRRTLLEVDTRSFEVRRPAPVASASGVWPGWPIAALAAGALLLVWLGVRRRGDENGAAVR